MQLIWFRQDLRTQDHTALWHALQAGPAVAMVILSPAQWQLHDDAAIKIDFFLRQLHDLQQQLQQLNIPLFFLQIDLWKDIPNTLLQFCQEHHIQQLHMHAEAGVNELGRDAHVQQLLEANQIPVQIYHDRTLFPFGSIRNKSGQPYQVFGAFKRYCYEQLSISLPQCYPAPQPQVWPLTSTFQAADIPKVQQFYPDFQETTQTWPEGEQYALALLDDFIAEQMPGYKEQRDFPAVTGTSQLSPYLNIGVLSIRQCLQALFREQEGHLNFQYDSQQTWLDELLWREFYLQLLFDHPRLSKHLPFQMHTQQLSWRDDAAQLHAWQTGQTGIPIVDAGMRQMLTTGWMHNRVRMITAMFLCKNLLLDWRLGECWFMQHLIDGDLAANNGGWQWCASTGTDAVPYFRIFNPVSQSRKFDPHGDYIRRWLPELAHLDAKTIHDPYAVQPEIQLDYPQPIVDLKSSRQRAIAAFKALSN